MNMGSDAATRSIIAILRECHIKADASISNIMSSEAAIFGPEPQCESERVPSNGGLKESIEGLEEKLRVLLSKIERVHGVIGEAKP